MKSPRIQAVVVQLPGLDEVVTAAVCEWTAWADFKAVCQEFELRKGEGVLYMSKSGHCCE
jgi:hypothetical protein